MNRRNQNLVAIFAALAFFLFPVEGAIGDDLEDLTRSYVELRVEYEKYRFIRENPGRHDRTTVNDASDQMEKISPAIKAIAQEIKLAGGKVPELPELRAMPDDTVTATDRKSGESASKGPDGNTNPSTRDQNPCDRYSSFELPATSAYVLPPLDRQSGVNRQLASALRDTERALMGHLTACERKWTAEMAKNWDGRRDALINQILELEGRYALAFAYPTYTEAENGILEIAYQDSPQLKGRVMNEQRLFERYMELKKRVEEAQERFGPVPHAATKLRLAKLIHDMKIAQTKWLAAANQITAIKQSQLNLWNSVQNARHERGRRQMKEFHPDTVFDFHDKQDYLKQDSKLLKKLLGEPGLNILFAESARRKTSWEKRQ